MNMNSSMARVLPAALRRLCVAPAPVLQQQAVRTFTRLSNPPAASLRHGYDDDVRPFDTDPALLTTPAIMLPANRFPANSAPPILRPPVASFYNPGVPRVAAGFHSTPRVMAAASGPADRSQDACDPASGAGSVMPGSAKAGFAGAVQAAGASNIGYGADVGVGDASTGTVSEETADGPGGSAVDPKAAPMVGEDRTEAGPSSKDGPSGTPKETSSTHGAPVKSGEAQEGGARSMGGTGSSQDKTEEILMDATMQGNVMLRTPPQSVPIDSDATMSMDSGASAKEHISCPGILEPHTEKEHISCPGIVEPSSSSPSANSGDMPITPEGNLKGHTFPKVPTSQNPIGACDSPPSASFPA